MGIAKTASTAKIDLEQDPVVASELRLNYRRNFASALYAAVFGIIGAFWLAWIAWPALQSASNDLYVWPPGFFIFYALFIAVRDMRRDKAIHLRTLRLGYTIKVDTQGVWLFERPLVPTTNLRSVRYLQEEGHFWGLEPGVLLFELKGSLPVVELNSMDWKLSKLRRLLRMNHQARSISLDLRDFQYSGTAARVEATVTALSEHAQRQGTKWVAHRADTATEVAAAVIGVICEKPPPAWGLWFALTLLVMAIPVGLVAFGVALQLFLRGGGLTLIAAMLVVPGLMCFLFVSWYQWCEWRLKRLLSIAPHVWAADDLRVDLLGVVRFSWRDVQAFNLESHHEFPRNTTRVVNSHAGWNAAFQLDSKIYAHLAYELRSRLPGVGRWIELEDESRTVRLLSVAPLRAPIDVLRQLEVLYRQSRERPNCNANSPVQI